MMINIRKENEKDYFCVENITREAFWNVYQPGCTEHYVLHILRKDNSFLPELDYVIEYNGKIIGHIAYALGKIEDGSKTEEAILFGPVSVLPEYQGKGYGTRLINFTLEKARELGYKIVCITGDPKYYSRFGFESCSKYKIYHKGSDKTENPYFMVKFLDPSFIGKIEGVFSESRCYFVDEKVVEEFDANFPYKAKEKRPEQLK